MGAGAPFPLAASMGVSVAVRDVERSRVGWRTAAVSPRGTGRAPPPGMPFSPGE